MILDGDNNIWLCTKPTDMRKGVNSLSQLVADEFLASPQSGDAFIFYNKTKKTVKILFWHFNGFCFLYKHLERETFKVPQNLVAPVAVNKKQFMRLLDGLNFINSESSKHNIFY